MGIGSGNRCEGIARSRRRSPVIRVTFIDFPLTSFDHAA